MDESLYNQLDLGMRTTDFFDATSDDEPQEEIDHNENHSDNIFGPRSTPPYLTNDPDRRISPLNQNLHIASRTSLSRPDSPGSTPNLTQLRDFLRSSNISRVAETPPPPPPKIKPSDVNNAFSQDSSSYESLDSATPFHATPVEIQHAGQGRIVQHSPRASGAYSDVDVTDATEHPVAPPRVLDLSVETAGTRADLADTIAYNSSQLSAVIPAVTSQTTADQIMGVHAITLSALIRDEEAVATTASATATVLNNASTAPSTRVSLHNPLPLNSSQTSKAYRSSLLPPPLSHTRVRTVSAPVPGANAPANTPANTPATILTPSTVNTAASSATRMKRKVSLVPPPPILTASNVRTSMEKPVKTPYPFYEDAEAAMRARVERVLGGQRVGRGSTWGHSTESAVESVITVCVRGGKGKRGSKVGRVIVPASTGFPRLPEKGRRDSVNNLLGWGISKRKIIPIRKEFDDEALFFVLRAEYAKLTGPWRFFSARCLKNITVGYSVAYTPAPPSLASCCCNPNSKSNLAVPAAAQGASRLASLRPSVPYAPRSPRLLAFAGLTDTFSEANLLHHFQHPHTARARYAWVHWARRLAASNRDVTTLSEKRKLEPPFSLPPKEEDGVDEEAGGAVVTGLEFVEGWSRARILTAVGIVLVLSVAATLCWVFLGVSGTLIEAGYRGAAGRATAGMLMGLLVLALGWSGVVVWVGVSWLVV